MPITGVLSNEQGTDLWGRGEALRLHVAAVGEECTRWLPEASPHPGILGVLVDESRRHFLKNKNIQAIRKHLTVMFFSTLIF